MSLNEVDFFFLFGVDRMTKYCRNTFTDWDVIIYIWTLNESFQLFSTYSLMHKQSFWKETSTHSFLSTPTVLHTSWRMFWGACHEELLEFGPYHWSYISVRCRLWSITDNIQTKITRLNPINMSHRVDCTRHRRESLINPLSWFHSLVLH